MNRMMHGAALLAAVAAGGIPAAGAADVTIVPQPQLVAGQDLAGGVRIGHLDCGIAGGVGYLIGSAKQIDCVFRSTTGSDERYVGTIRKLGVDVGFTTGSRLLWAVFAPTAGLHRGSLGGIYRGATAEATLGAGVGANVLVGGTMGSINLQPVSVTGQLGLNLAASGTSLTLDAVN